MVGWSHIRALALSTVISLSRFSRGERKGGNWRATGYVDSFVGRLASASSPHELVRASCRGHPARAVYAWLLSFRSRELRIPTPTFRAEGPSAFGYTNPDGYRLSSEGVCVCE